VIEHREQAGGPVSAARRHWHWLALLVVLGPGCDPPGRPRAGDRPIRDDRVVDFDTLYRRNCSGCHGADGKLGPAPPLNDPLFLAIVPDAVLLDLVRNGRPGTPMPAFDRARGGTLTDAQVRALAEGIKPRWKKGPPVAGPLPAYSIADLDGTKPRAGDVGRGGKVFARACAGCHGARGEGGKEIGAVNDPAFLPLISDQALRRYAITGRPDLGMPGYAGKDSRPDSFSPLTSAEIDDLVALLADWRRGGSGHDHGLLSDGKERN
jgi:cytochrome c oxidase cbb3-type subunit III